MDEGNNIWMAYAIESSLVSLQVWLLGVVVIVWLFRPCISNFISFDIPMIVAKPESSNVVVDTSSIILFFFVAVAGVMIDIGGCAFLFLSINAVWTTLTIDYLWLLLGNFWRSGRSLFVSMPPSSLSLFCTLVCCCGWCWFGEVMYWVVCWCAKTRCGVICWVWWVIDCWCTIGCGGGCWRVWYWEWVMGICRCELLFGCRFANRCKRSSIFIVFCLWLFDLLLFENDKVRGWVVSEFYSRRDNHSWPCSSWTETTLKQRGLARRHNTRGIRKHVGFPIHEETWIWRKTLLKHSTTRSIDWICSTVSRSLR